MKETTYTSLIGLFTILTLSWVVLYLIPEVAILLFDTLLGNLWLILGVVLVYARNRVYGLTLGITLLILYRFGQLSSRRESFTQASETQFLQHQHLMHRDKVFDMDVLNTQATQEELDTFNQEGQWPWSESTVQLYKEAIRTNPHIRTLPEDAVNYARSLYNEHAILRLLSYQTKEGQFLIHGLSLQPPLPSGMGTFGYTAGLQTPDIIRCSMKDIDHPSLERISVPPTTGIPVGTPVYPQELTSVLPGFSFEGTEGPCNPCNALKPIPDYSCRFRLHDQPPSNVWNYLWGKKSKESG